MGCVAGGARFEDIQRSQPHVGRRTLQGRISRLVRDGRLTQTGERKGTRYFLPAPQQVQPSSLPPPAADQIPISIEGKKVRDLVSRPLTERTPVGYNRHFLDSYRPNKTAYLSEQQRAELWSAGMAPAQEGPAGTYARQILERLLIDLAFNSSRLEGNTYSLLETQRLIALGYEARRPTSASTWQA